MLGLGSIRTGVAHRGSEAEPFVVMDRVSKVYGGNVAAVRDLCLSIGKGEFLTMLGPSGSGKTTSLMMLAGFETPTSGRIHIGGNAVEDVPAHRRNIGVVFQNYALFPHMTVRENIGFPLSVRGMSKAEMSERILRSLDLVRMRAYADRSPAQLSGGQQQRVALARAIVIEPPLILMDEPLGALDRQLREQLQIEIKHIHAQLDITLIYVTHDQSEALTMSDRIVVFKDGMVQQVATPFDLYERPASTFVAQFIGESVQLSGRLTARDGAHCWVEVDGGHRMQAVDAAHNADIGDRVVLSVRPERLMLNPPSGHDGPTIAATIEEIIFHGDCMRVRLSALGEHAFLVKVPNGRQAIPQGLGESATVGWLPDDWRALDASPLN